MIRTLLRTSGGDLRRAITYFQSASRLSMSTSPPTPITSFEIEEIAGTVPDEIIERLGNELGAERSGEAMDVDAASRVKSFAQIKGQIRSLIQSGYAATQVLSQLHDLVVLHPTLNSRQKARCALIFAEADKALSDGADEELWLLDVALRVHKALMP